MTPNEPLKFSETTGKIIGCAMQVHSWLGFGFPEHVYKRSLCIELGNAGLRYQQEVEREIFYRGHVIGKRRLDLIVADHVLVELKAVSCIDDSAISQTLNYLKVFDLEIGLILNFGASSLQFKRLVNTGRHPRNPIQIP